MSKRNKRFQVTTETDVELILADVRSCRHDIVAAAAVGVGSAAFVVGDDSIMDIVRIHMCPQICASGVVVVLLRWLAGNQSIILVFRNELTRT